MIAKLKSKKLVGLEANEGGACYLIR